MTDELQIRPGVVIPLSEVEIRATRSSGPGGQHANVTASRIEASFDVHASQSLSESEKRRIAARLGPRVAAVAQDTRSQARNRDLALERLARRLATALEVARPRHATRPSKGAQRARLEAKRRRGARKDERRRPPGED